MKIKRLAANNMIITGLLILFLAGGFLLSSIPIRNITIKNGLNTLRAAAQQLASELQNDASSAGGQLNTIADILAQYEDLSSDEALQVICSYRRQNSISVIGMLLPDDSIYFCDGRYTEKTGFSFAEEVEKVPYISDLEPFDQQMEQTVHLAVPIVRDNDVVGILYGFVDLPVLSTKYSCAVFENSAEYIIVDGNKGDIIADTWHDSLGNINDPGMQTRETKSKKTYNEMRQDVSSGREGTIMFRSQTLGHGYLYGAYLPVGINNWSVMVFAPEAVVLKTVRQVQTVFYIIGALDILLLFAYLIWIFLEFRKKTLKKEQELKKTLYIMEVQKLLFGVHTDTSFLEKALEKCAQVLQAKQAFFLTLEGGQAVNLYIGQTAFGIIRTGDELSQMIHIPSVVNGVIQEHRSIIINNAEEESGSAPQEYGQPGEKKISSLMAVPVLDNQERLRGIIGAVDFRKSWESAELLECVTANFLMAVLNYDSYLKIQEMGLIDLLTGMQNRNCYQSDLLELSEQNHHSLCCIYMDVNGLHELNNHLGHAAGDEMLRTVAGSLKQHFGKENCYRIGGDEFVVFCKDAAPEAVEEKLTLFRGDMSRENYFVSIGSFWQDTSLQIDVLISNAEREMYEDKRRYYEHRGDLEKAREMNQKLEQILLEKRDFENFLTLIAHYFLGVYVVDLQTDHTRVIYKPTYFDEILRSHDGKFTASMQEYTERFVQTEDQEALSSFLDYENVKKSLLEKKAAYMLYKKRNGIRLRVRVFASPGFGEDHWETFWLFEEVVAKYR